MKVNVTAPLTDLDGNAIPVPVQTAQLAQQVLALLAENRVQDVRAACNAALAVEPLTLRKVACDALMAQFQDEQNLPGEKKAERFALMLKLRASDEVVISVEDAALLKTLIGKGFGPLVVGRAYAMLERDDVPKPK